MLLLFCFYTIGGKLLVYAGILNDDGSLNTDLNTAEVLDLLDEEMECDTIINGHSSSIIGSSGGRINNEFIYCGGSFEKMYSGVTTDCRILGKGYPGDPFHTPLDLTVPDGRSTANGGVILPNNTLFIAGKYENTAE